VAFTDRLEEDAHRRDFTVNALYATRRTATVLDPTGEGRADLQARRIRFIGDAP
jgi:poly(A) polymerase